MAKRRERIIVFETPNGMWRWVYEKPIVPQMTKPGAISSARAFARKFVNPPDVVVEGEEDGKA